MEAVPSMADPPFACPPDIVLDLPPPISVNRLRRIDWAAHGRQQAWKRGADAYVFAAKCRRVNPIRLTKIPRFEIAVTLDEQLVKIDLDNSVKMLIDYLSSIGLIEDDSPKHMRRLTVEWGSVATGCRVIVRPCA